MPRRDGTGPMGQGTMTGRALGFCADFNAVGFGFGRGCGRGRGAGNWFRRGFRGYFVGGPSVLTDRELLAEQKEILQRKLDIINGQLENLSEGAE